MCASFISPQQYGGLINVGPDPDTGLTTFELTDWFATHVQAFLMFTFGLRLEDVARGHYKVGTAHLFVADLSHDFISADLLGGAADGQRGFALQAFLQGGGSPVVLPAGLTGFDPVRAPYRRWNGAVWGESVCAEYNRQLAGIRRSHERGLSDVQQRINDLYRYAAHADQDFEAGPP